MHLIRELKKKHEAKTERTKRRNKSIIIADYFNTPLLVNDRTQRQKTSNKTNNTTNQLDLPLEIKSPTLNI